MIKIQEDETIYPDNIPIDVPVFDVTIKHPYYQSDENDWEDYDNNLLYSKMIIKARDEAEAKSIALNKIKSYKCSKNSKIWKDAYIVSIYRR